MQRPEFEKLIEEIFQEILDINRKKGADYTRGNEDALINFKQSAEYFGMTPMQALGIFMNKHTSAIHNYIKTCGQSESEPIRERIKDNILYLLLLLGLIEEKRLDLLFKEVEKFANDSPTFESRPLHEVAEHPAYGISNVEYPLKPKPEEFRSSNAVLDILRERKSQEEKHGFTIETDSATGSDLVGLALGILTGEYETYSSHIDNLSKSRFNRKSAREKRVIAAALLIADIERFDYNEDIRMRSFHKQYPLTPNEAFPLEGTVACGNCDTTRPLHAPDHHNPAFVENSRR